MANETTLTIIGNLTADPDLKVTSSGQAVASFTIASTPRTLDKASGQWTDGQPLFMRCSAWRDLGEHVAESLSKGARVIATGRLKQRQYEKDGQTRTAIELDVEEIGPSLRYASATVKKMSRTNGGQSSGGFGSQQTSKPADDPWAQNNEAAPF